MTKLYAVLLAVLLFPLSSWGQTTLTGKVTATDEPGGLPGATVQVSGTSRGVSTNAEGTYSLPLEAGDTAITVSFIGYDTQHVNIVGKTTADVLLSSDVKQMSEVVVVGYGTQRKSDITGAVSSVRGEDLVKVPNNNPVQALQGKVAGVQVTSNSGQPGTSPNVRIRGIGSINSGVSPLYVVDGVFMDDISSINSQDIESIELLKDASAAAIFGVRGANGVILVTTKRGKSGKPTFGFTAEYGWQTNYRHINVLNGLEFAQIQADLGIRDPILNTKLVPNTDWQQQVFRAAAPIQNYQFSASGGSENGTYYLGVGYFDQAGILPNSSYRRLSVRFNNTYNLTKWWQFGSNFTVAPSTQRIARDVTATAYLADPSVTPYDTSRNRTSPYSPINAVGNPLADLDYTSYVYNKSLQGVGNLFSEIKLPYGFKYRINFGFDVTTSKGTSFVPQFLVNALQTSPYNQLTTARGFTSHLLLDNILYWNKAFGSHSFDAFIATSAYSNYSESFSGNAINLVSANPNDWYLNSGTVQGGNVREGANASTQLSYFGRVTYSLLNRYLVTLTDRLDYSSLFSAQNRSANFPSAALGWVASEESFMQEVPAISYLKLRTSLGKLGNQSVDPAFQNARFSTINTLTPAVFGSGNVLTQGASPGVPANPNLKWEITTQYDAGLEVSFLQRRLSFEADYYNRRTDDILVGLQVPGFFGAGSGISVLYNAASVRNYGYEFTVNWKDQIGQVSYRLGALGTTVNNNVISLGARVPADTIIRSGSVANGNLTGTTPGYPIGSYFGYQTIGVFQNEDETRTQPGVGGDRPGDLKYRDVNHDGKIDANDRVYLGSPIPKFIFGFSAGVGYKGFDLSADFQGQTGNVIYNAKATNRFSPTAVNFESFYRDRWSPTNTGSTIPAINASSQASYQVSDYWIQRGDFIRLRSLTLSYTVPQEFSRRYRIERFSIYGRGTNVFTWTPYTGYTPEVGGDILNSGIDRGTYPLPRIWTIGANITF